MRVGIVGYGNLGKAIEKRLMQDKCFKLVAIFSKRKISGVVPYENILDYKDKIDFLFLCGGSQNELEHQSFTLIKHFNIVESYDNHNRLEKYIKKLDGVAKRYKKIALCSFGWDPGLFSLMRALFSGLGLQPYTFWGKGLSQGHTQAIKNISGVVDAIQFTLPNEKMLTRVEKGSIVEQSKKFHKRLCYVVAKKQAHENIKRAIVHMPDYFEGYETTVKFISQKKLDQLKTFAHQGVVTTRNAVAKFSLKLPSNPQFTASVAVAFAQNVKILQKQKICGAFTILDLPIANILKENKFKFL